MPLHRVRPTENHQNHVEIITDKSRAEKVCEVNKAGNWLFFCKPSQRKNHDEQGVCPTKRKCNQVDEKISACCRSVGVMIAYDDQCDNEEKRSDEMCKPAAEQEFCNCVGR